MVFWKKLLTPPKVATPSTSLTLDGAEMELLHEPDHNIRIYLSTECEIDLYELEDLCDLVGWTRRPLRKVRRALRNSYLVFSMWEQEGNQKRLIGFARATSDHAFNATIWDVVVHPRFQKRGFGRALMEYAVTKLRRQEISNITLFADPQVIDFYRRMGFVLEPEGIRGMFWYPH